MRGGDSARQTAEFEGLTGIDAGFLYMETPTLLMHTLKIAVVDPGPGYDVDRARAVLAKRMHLLPPFRRRLVEVPFGLAHPVWVDDDEVDLDAHVTVRRIPGGDATMADLDAVIAEVAEGELPRDRPLWELVIVEGLRDGHVAFIAKIHHSLADGMAALGLLRNVLDDEPGLPDPEPDASGPGGGDASGSARTSGRSARRRDPSRAELLAYARTAWVRMLAGLPGLIAATLRGLWAVIRSRTQVRAPAALPFSGPRAAFNRALTPNRCFATTTIPLATLRSIRRRSGATLNDVVLACVGGALRADALAAGEPVTRSMIATVPVSTAAGSEAPRLFGNRVNNLFTTLATDEADPATRLARIHEVTAAAKARHEALGQRMLEDWVEFTPPRPYSAAVRAWSRWRVADHLPPPANVVVSNVPGPRHTLHVADAKLEGIWSMGPILEGIGLNVTVWSYRDQLHVSVMGCPEQVPDIAGLADRLRAAAEELSAAFGEVP